MPTNYPHTPGRWVYQYGASYLEAGPRLLLADRNTPDTTPTERDANVRRAVDCVNACNGIEDPDRAHAVARDALREAHRSILDILEFKPESYGEYYTKRLARLSEAHALLGGGPL